MHYSSAFLIAALAAYTSAHSVIASTQGANGATMPGLSGMTLAGISFTMTKHSPAVAADGTLRDCATPACGSEADTSIIRSKELGTNKATALGRTSEVFYIQYQYEGVLILILNRQPILNILLNIEY